jgi:hypothetical protein
MKGQRKSQISLCHVIPRIMELSAFKLDASRVSCSTRADAHRATSVSTPPFRTAIAAFSDPTPERHRPRNSSSKETNRSRSSPDPPPALEEAFSSPSTRNTGFTTVAAASPGTRLMIPARSSRGVAGEACTGWQQFGSEGGGDELVGTGDVGALEGEGLDGVG